MSLINDALRRARQDQRADAAPLVAPALTGDGPPTLEPVEPPPLSPWTALLPVIGVGLLVLALAGTGGWFIWKAVHRPRASKLATPAVLKPAPPRVTTNTMTPALPLVAQITPTNPPAGLSNAPIAAASPATHLVAAAVTNPAPASAPPAPPPVKWPALRLQGIIFRPPDSSSVVINNKTLYLDDVIEGARVVDITHRSVTLVFNGQTNAMVLR